MCKILNFLKNIKFYKNVAKKAPRIDYPCCIDTFLSTHTNIHIYNISDQQKITLLDNLTTINDDETCNDDAVINIDDFWLLLLFFYVCNPGKTMNARNCSNWWILFVSALCEIDWFEDLMSVRLTFIFNITAMHDNS